MKCNLICTKSYELWENTSYNWMITWFTQVRYVGLVSQDTVLSVNVAGGKEKRNSQSKLLQVHGFLTR